MPLDRNRLGELATFYRKHLIDDVMGFWDARCADPDGPGYLISFNREGELTATDKYVWTQARQAYMYGALYNHIEPRDNWLSLAKRGRDFLVNHAHAGGGRFHYCLDRSGHVMQDNRSAFTDAFALMALCEHAIATQSDDDRELIETTYDALAKHLMTPGFDEWHHHPLDPKYRWHGPMMVGVGAADVVRPVLGEEKVKPLADYCLHQILHVFTKPDYKCTFEMLAMDDSVVQSDLGLRINPGHVIESSWFCMEEALHRGDREAFDLAVRNCDWAYQLGFDPHEGGLFAFVDPHGGQPAGMNEPNPWGENWDSKIWWVHSEALYALLLSAVEKQSQPHFNRFLDLHDYTQRVFHDREYGEWYCYLDRAGKPTIADKGTWVKSAFHLARNLMKIVLLLDRAAK
jgi:N-acylglucosamine 2-epimerase